MSSLSAIKAHQRRVSRTNLTCLAYLNFEPDNGGIVLNISEEGLCFQAFAPLEVNAKASFWFSGASSGIAAEGLVVWTDATGKTGGLRFNHLSPEARRQIRTWTEQSSKSIARPTQVAAPMPQSPSDAPVANRGYVAAPEYVAASAVLRSFWKWVRTIPRWSEFSRGLVTGLLFALSVTALFSLHTRQRIGDALIWLGERFEPTPQPRVASSSPHSSTAYAPQLTVQPHMRAAPVAAIPMSTPPPSHEKPPLPALATAAPRTQPKLASAKTSVPAVPSPSIPSLPLLSPPTFVPVPPEGAHLASPAKILAAKAVDRSNGNENAEDVLEINSSMPLGKYFEVGKLKDQLAAFQKRHDLENLGFRAVVLPKSLLWIKSYQVLVGPYHNDQDAERARRNLQADGLTPRSLGEHSRQLTLVVSWANPTDSAERDDFIVTWEAYSAEAKVKLVEAGQVGRTAIGKWVKLPAKSDYTGIVCTVGKTGARTLLSIQFHGMNQAVMLADSTDNSIVF